MPTIPSDAARLTRHSVPDDLDADYVDESHIEAFANALQAEDVHEDNDDTGQMSPNTPTLSPRVRKVSALSDFAPVNMKVKRRRNRNKANNKRQDWLFLLLRWPLLFFILLIIMGEFGLYIVIRQLVNGKEWLLAWRGRKGVLRKKLRAARTYQEWKDAAETLDKHLRFHDWKMVDEDPYYDWKLVRKVRRSLQSLREKNDVRGVLGVLETCIRTNFAGVESSRLYSETFLGTKDLIESYFNEQQKALEYVRKSPDLSNEEKKRFFKSANTNLGSTALCLSGGGSFGYYHFGVVKAFLDAKLMPRVITGTSAGGLIAALVCTRTDSELQRLLVPELANKITACEESIRVWFKRFWTTGARFDSVLWARKCTFFTRGSMTFREAYLRTGRILNISVIPADRHSPTKLLNYLTAPDTVIWSTLLASSAVPGILNPVVLLEKLKDGRVVPWNWGSKFKDGSLRVDIPVQALNLYFNVTYPVVSQVNPHVHLFFFAPRGSAGRPTAHMKGKGWRGNFVLSAMEQWLKLELSKNFKVIRDLELLPPLLGQDWSSVFLQRFDGAVTIWPRTRVWDWFRILSDPDPAELTRMIRVGQTVTWPKLHMIENRHRIEKEILIGRQVLRRSVQSRTPALTPDATLGTTPEPSTGTRLLRISLSPAPAGSDVPLSVDTDAETAYTNSIRSPFKRDTLTDVSGLQTSRDSDSTNSPGHVRLPVSRRKRASNFLGVKVSDSEGTESNNRSKASPYMSTPPTPKHTNPPTSPDGFFTRFRTQSFPTLPSPFSTLRRSIHPGHEPSKILTTEHAWSSDSSSEEDLPLADQRHPHRPSILSFRPLDPTNEIDAGAASNPREKKGERHIN